MFVLLLFITVFVRPGVWERGGAGTWHGRRYTSGPRQCSPGMPRRSPTAPRPTELPLRTWGVDGQVMVGQGWSGMVRDGHGWSWMVKDGQGWSGRIRNGQGWPGMVMDGHGWSGRVRNDQGWPGMVRDGKGSSGMVRDDQMGLGSPLSRLLDHSPADDVEGSVCESSERLVLVVQGSVRLLHRATQEGDKPPPVTDGTLHSGTQVSSGHNGHITEFSMQSTCCKHLV